MTSASFYAISNTIMSFEKRLQELGIILPETPKPIGNYVPAITDGDRMLFTAGMICLKEGQITHAGKLGLDLDGGV